MRAALMAALLFSMAANTGSLAASLTAIAVESGAARIPLQVEVVRSDSDRRRGLMGREALAADQGMLFVYGEEQRPDDGFWMYRTLIPLDIAFLDRTGRILAVRTMSPCTAADARRCPVYAPGIGYWYALELNSGFFNRYGIQVGDLVRLEALAPR